VAKHLSGDLAFEHWVEWTFDHPAAESEWYLNENAERWTSSVVVTVDYITRLFEAATTHLAKFSDAQASQGLWLLAMGTFCDGLGSLYGEGVLQTQRQRCIRSIYTLFEQYFAARCSPHLSYIDEQGANPLNVTCYMWWDLLHHHADGPDGRVGSDMDSEMLATMESILRLNHDACMESALHGLGHWQRYRPAEAAEIIDGFLASNPNIRPELRTYALEARTGRVL
jgi:hypothetical protein